MTDTLADLAPQWQDIATAPTDTIILVCQSQNNIILTARGTNRHGHWQTGAGPMDYLVGVTHWMPLPTPPEPKP